MTDPHMIRDRKGNELRIEYAPLPDLLYPAWSMGINKLFDFLEEQERKALVIKKKRMSTPINGAQKGFFTVFSYSHYGKCGYRGGRRPQRSYRRATLRAQKFASNFKKYSMKKYVKKTN